MRNIFGLGAIIGLLSIVLTGCAVGSGAREVPPPPSVVNELQSAKTVAVLGYNTSKGLDDRLLDDFIRSGIFDIDLSVDMSLEDTIKFPVGSMVDAHDSEFIRELGNTRYTVIPKETVLSSPAYQAIKGDPAGTLANVNAATGYTLTYQFDNWMDQRSGSSSANRVPAPGQLVNNFREVLEELGADLGIIVVEKPYVRTQHYALFPHQWIHKKEPYFAVATSTTYYLIRPATINQVLYSKHIIMDSDTQYLRKGYTQEMRSDDEVNFLDQYADASRKNRAAFIEWLNGI